MARELLKDETFTVTEMELAELPENPLRQVDLETTYTIRATTDGLVDRLRKKHTTTKWQNHQMVKELNALEFAKELIDTVLVDWTGITSNGVPMPCTADNKIGLDESVRIALVERSRLNRIVKQAQQEESFRAAS